MNDTSTADTNNSIITFPVLRLRYAQKVQHLHAEISMMTNSSAATAALNHTGLTNLIMTAFKTSNAEQRTSAENSLDILRKSSIIQHAESVFIAIALATDEGTLMCLTTYAYSLAKSIENLSYFQENNENILQLIAVVFYSMRNPLLTRQMVFIMCDTIATLAEISPHSEPDMVTAIALFEVEDKFTAENKREIFVGLSALHAIQQNVFASSEIQMTLFNLLKRLFIILDALVNAVFNELIQLHSTNQPIAASQDISANVSILKMISSVISVTIQRVNNKQQSHECHPMESFMQSTQLLNYFQMILKFNFNALLSSSNSSADNQITLITYAQSINNMKSSSNANAIQQLNECMSNLNVVKYNTVKSLIAMNAYYMAKEKIVRNTTFDTQDIEKSHSIFLSAYEEVLRDVCNQLRMCLTLNTPDLHLALQTNTECLNNLDISVQFVLQSVRDQRLYRFFSSTYKEIFLSIIVNLMSTSAHDYESYAQCDEEFLRFEQDLYQLRYSNVIKSNACELLFRMTATIDGFLAFVVSFCSTLIRHTCQSANSMLSQQQKQEQLLPKYYHDIASIFLATPPANQIETALLVLVVVAPLVARRPDLLNEIERVLVEHFTESLVRISGISRLRCSAIINVYSRYLFFKGTKKSIQQAPIGSMNGEDSKEKPQLLIEMVSYLIQQFQDTSEPKGVEIAIDVLCRLVYRIELRESIELIIVDLVSILVENISSCSNDSFFDFLAKVIYTYGKAIRSQATYIVKYLCARIVLEQAEIEAKRIQSSLIITKCAFCLQEFFKNESTMNEFYMYFEEYTKQLLTFFDRIEKISFVDELTDIGTSILAHVNEYDESTEIVFRNIERVWEKNKKHLLSSSLVNLIAQVFQSQYLLHDKQYIICACFRIVVGSISQLNLQALASDYAEFIEGCYLLQNGMWHCHSVFLSKQKLFEDMLDFLSQTYALLSSQSELFYPVKFIQVFLFFFTYYPQETLARVDYQIIAHIFSNLRTIYAEKCIANSMYNKKVLIHGILGIFHVRNQAIQRIPVDHLVMLMQLLIKVLSQSPNAPLIKASTSANVNMTPEKVKQNNNNNYHASYDSDDDTWLVSNEDPSDLEFSVNASLKHKFYENPEKELNERIEKSNSPICGSDEYNMYRSQMKQFRKSHGELCLAIQSGLTEDERICLIQLEKQSIVQVSENQFEVRKIRKFKKKQITQNKTQQQLPLSDSPSAIELEMEERSL